MKYTSLRNSSAHEAEVEFARMLLSTDLYETEEYYKWAGLFPYTYGGSIEEVAARDELEPAPEPKFSPPTKKYQFWITFVAQLRWERLLEMMSYCLVYLEDEFKGDGLINSVYKRVSIISRLIGSLKHQITSCPWRLVNGPYTVGERRRTTLSVMRSG